MLEDALALREKIKRGVIAMLGVTLLVPSTLFLFARNNVISGFPSKQCFLALETLPIYKYSQKQFTILVHDSAERLDSNNISCWQLLSEKASVWSWSVSCFFTVSSHIAQIAFLRTAHAGL